MTKEEKKEARKISSKKYREANKEKVAAKARFYNALPEVKVANAERYQENKGEIDAKRKIYRSQPEVKSKNKKTNYEYRKKNKIKLTKQGKAYRSKPEVKEKNHDAKYRKKNKKNISAHNSLPKVKARNKELKAKWHQENKERLAAQHKIYRALPENKERRNALARSRRITDICFKLNSNMSKRIWHALGKNKNNEKFLDYVDYTAPELKLYIESLWEPWMSWDNYGMEHIKGHRCWHIDHIIPVSSFQFTSMQCQGFKDCWELSNLRPLDQIENIRKGNRLDWS